MSGLEREFRLDKLPGLMRKEFKLPSGKRAKEIWHIQGYNYDLGDTTIPLHLGTPDRLYYHLSEKIGKGDIPPTVIAPVRELLVNFDQLTENILSAVNEFLFELSRKHPPKIELADDKTLLEQWQRHTLRPSVPDHLNAFGPILQVEWPALQNIKATTTTMPLHHFFSTNTIERFFAQVCPEKSSFRRYT